MSFDRRLLGRNLTNERAYLQKHLYEPTSIGSAVHREDELASNIV